jgi:hypothetical protein
MSVTEENKEKRGSMVLRSTENHRKYRTEERQVTLMPRYERCRICD